MRSILCGMCFPIMNIIFSIFETNSQLSCFKMAINISFVLLYPTLRLYSTHLCGIKCQLLYLKYFLYCEYNFHPSSNQIQISKIILGKNNLF